MPILTGAPTVVDVTPVPQVLPNRTAASWSWESADGEVLSLTDGQGSLFLEPGGITGHMLPPLGVYDTTPPVMDGGVWRSDKWLPRTLGVRVTVAADTPAEWRDTTRGLARVLRAGEGRLVCQHWDGQRRHVNARYRGGLESPDGGDQGARFYGVFPVQLVAYDPWWYGPDQQWTFTVADPVPLFNRTFPHSMPEATTVGAPATIPNLGDETTWPRWTFWGPMTDASVSIDGHQLDIDYTLGSTSSRVVVDTDPRLPATAKVTDGAGTNLWGVATGDFPDLFGLPAGSVDVTVSVTGQSVDTRVVLDYSARYSTA